MLDNFLRNFTSYLEPSRFRVSIPAPFALRPMGIDFIRWASDGIYCHTAELPSKGFATAESVIYGPDRKMPYRTQFTDFECEFYVGGNNTNGDNADQVLEYFRRWQALIIDDNHDVSYSNDYVTDIHVDILTRKGTGIPGLGSINVRLPEIGGEPLAELSFLKSKELKPVHSIVVRNAYPVTVNQIPLSWATEGMMSLRVTFAYYQWTNANEHSSGGFARTDDGRIIR